MSQTEEFRVAAAGVPSTAQTGRGGPTASVAGAGTAADLPQRLGLFWTFWRSIVPVGVPPKRGFDPSAVPPRLLPNLAIYERIAPDHFRIRVMGTEVVRRVGIEGTGRNVLDLLPPGPGRDRIAGFMNALLDHPCGGRSVVEDLFPSGRRSSVDILRLPLADADGRPRYLVSCSAEGREEDYRDPDGPPIQVSRPLRLDWLDIGHGTP